MKPGRHRSAEKERLRLIVLDRLKLATAEHGGFKSRLPLGDLKKIKAMLDQRDRLVEALRQLHVIGTGGVIERRETGKPTWYALDEVARISGDAITKARR